MYCESPDFMSMQDLLREYRNTLRHLEEMKENASDEDKKVLGSMASDLQYAIKWMKTGRLPGNKRGIERRSAYQREKIIDPIVMQKFFKSIDTDPFDWIDQQPSSTINESVKNRIEDALCVLTDNEKEMYLMSRGHTLSYSEIAGYFNVKKGTVQKTVERAEKKISKRINESLFCLCG
jgi:positive control factor